MPVSITCIVQRRDLLYNQLLWMKGDTFVGIDKDHSLSISQHDDNKRNYELIIHATVETTPYTCMLVSTNGNVVSSITQYVIVDGKQLQKDTRIHLWHSFCRGRPNSVGSAKVP